MRKMMLFTWFDVNGNLFTAGLVNYFALGKTIIFPLYFTLLIYLKIISSHLRYTMQKHRKNNVQEPSTYFTSFLQHFVF